MIGLPELVLLLVIGRLALLSLVLWIWALVDCLTNEPAGSPHKLLWMLVILLGQGLGALVYLLFRRPQRMDR